jgi:hypothetical protein
MLKFCSTQSGKCLSLITASLNSNPLLQEPSRNDCVASHFTANKKDPYGTNP